MGWRRSAVRWGPIGFYTDLTAESLPKIGQIECFESVLGNKRGRPGKIVGRNPILKGCGGIVEFGRFDRWVQCGGEGGEECALTPSDEVDFFCPLLNEKIAGPDKIENAAANERNAQKTTKTMGKIIHPIVDLGIRFIPAERLADSAHIDGEERKAFEEFLGWRKGKEVGMARPVGNIKCGLFFYAQGLDETTVWRECHSLAENGLKSFLGRNRVAAE